MRAGLLAAPFQVFPSITHLKPQGLRMHSEACAGAHDADMAVALCG